MTDDPTRIFDPFAADAPPLAGRAEDLSWLAAQLGGGGRVLLSGAEGMGKTALVFQAAALAQQEASSILLRLDFSGYEDLAEMNRMLHETVQGLAAHVRQAARLGDVDRVGVNRGPSPASLRGTARDAALLKEELGQFSRLVGLTERRGIVFLDGCESLRGPSGREIGAAVERCMGEHRRLAYLVCGREVLRSEGGLKPGTGAVAEKTVGPVRPADLASWIDQRFAAAGVMVDRVGEICTRLGGPRTRDVVELAKLTLALARKAGVATANTVGRAMAQWTARTTPEHAAAWQSLSPVEQRLVRRLSGRQTGEPLRVGDCMDQFELGHLQQVKTERDLVRKGFLEKLPDGRVFVASATFAHWTATQQEQLGRGVSFQVRSASVSFSRQSSARGAAKREAGRSRVE